MTIMRPDEIRSAAKSFVDSPPHQEEPFSKRNWGGTLHSLCSYQGKLKPSIAHFLVARFTKPGDRVLDPMAGVGTIPLEARLQGRVGLAGDLSPLAVAVSRAKLEAFDPETVEQRMRALRSAIALRGNISVAEADFGLNGPISSYFHPDTLSEIIAARRYFADRRIHAELDSADSVILSGLLHILHGNRPYALSRRSHPITPFAPQGEFEYRSVTERLDTRLRKTVPLLTDLRSTTIAGKAAEVDFRDSQITFEESVDAVITSPPFASSFRFWSTNWMRLWMAGWEPDDFKIEPSRFLETEQRSTFAPYGEFAKSMSEVLKPGGTLILHLGETAKENMAQEISPYLDPYFQIESVGRESVLSGESHGIRDKGGTVAHWYLFASRR